MATDPEIVERLRAGDEAAFTMLIAAYGPTMQRVAQMYVRDREAAKEVVQETWLAVLNGIDAFEGRSSLKTWIFRIAVNHCRSCLGRKHLPMQPLAEEQADEEKSGAVIADPGRGPEELAVAADCGRRVTAGLARLPESFRVAVVLRDLEGLSYEEIAEVLGVRIGTVRSRIARGRDQLRSFLEGSP